METYIYRLTVSPTMLSTSSKLELRWSPPNGGKFYRRLLSCWILGKVGYYFQCWQFADSIVGELSTENLKFTPSSYWSCQRNIIATVNLTSIDQWRDPGWWSRIRIVRIVLLRHLKGAISTYVMLLEHYIQSLWCCFYNILHILNLWFLIFSF